MEKKRETKWLTKWVFHAVTCPPNSACAYVGVRSFLLSSTIVLPFQYDPSSFPGGIFRRFIWCPSNTHTCEYKSPYPWALVEPCNPWFMSSTEGAGKANPPTAVETRVAECIVAPSI
jgi:hypothetical protein